MKNWFFHQEKGKTIGPVTLEEIHDRVRQGRIRLFDLVYRDGDSGWRMAMEHPDLKKEFKASTTETMIDRPWVCLQKKSETSFEFSTSGPFSTSEIRNNIQEGLVSYSDYVWRDGFAEWRRIGSLEDFNSRLAGAAKDLKTPPPPGATAAELLKNVVEMKRGTSSQPESSVPPEAVTPDLTLPPPVERRVEAAPVKIERRKSKPPMASHPDAARAEESRRRLGWIDISLGILLLGVVVASLLYYLNFAKNGDVPAEAALPPPPPPVAEEVAPPVKPEAPAELAPAAAPEPPVAEKPAADKAPQNSAPTELVLNVQSAGANQVKIELRTDASGDEFPVFLQIIGLPGQVADGASYYKYLKLSAKGDRRAPLDLSGVDLPQGKFVLRAETGNLKREAKMNVGTGEASYKQTVARLRKVHAHAVWKDRLELLRLSEMLDRALTQNLGGKKLNTKGLEALLKVKKSNGANYIHFDQWFELKEILNTAKSGPSMALLGRLKQIREKLAVLTVWK